MSTAENRALVERFWTDLYNQDAAASAAYFAEDGEYTDVPTPAEDVARGPAQIQARLELATGSLSSFSHDVRLMLCDGDSVVTEHTEHWEWKTGERASLPFVSVMELRDGKIVRWWDYWNLNTLLDSAPAWWLEEIMTKSAEIGLRDES